MLDSEIETFSKSDLGRGVKFIVLDHDGVCCNDMDAKIRALALWKRSSTLSHSVDLSNYHYDVYGNQRNSTCSHDDLFKIDVILVNPWSLEQYQALCSNLDFMKAVGLQLETCFQ